MRLILCCTSCLYTMHCYFQPSVRFEACRGLYRLSLIKENSCLIQLMDALLDSLPLAQSLQSRESSHARRQEPSAREYFSILCRLVDGLPSVEGGEKVQGLFVYSVLATKSKKRVGNTTRSGVSSRASRCLEMSSNTVFKCLIHILSGN